MIGRLIGIDHGLKRIGVATCDALGIVATEYTIIENTNDDQIFEQLQSIANQEFAVAFVVGIPLSDLHPEQAEIVQEWATKLDESTPLPVLLWDEQLSSRDAKMLAKQKKRKPNAPIDDLAARVILQSYIDAVQDGLAEPPHRI